MVETGDLANARPRGSLKGKQLKYLVGGIILALTVGYLVFSAASGSAAYYVTIEELGQQGPLKRNVRVAGNIVGESIVWEPRDLRLEFDILDESGRLSVVYHGSRPDMFRDGAEVVVEGKLAPGGAFEATTMLLKCPSRYEEAR
jgi:cytochrome c-type biogenesis protein CcmE